MTPLSVTPLSGTRLSVTPLSGKLRDAFLDQARACDNLGSPFMGRLMRVCADILNETTAVGARILNWPGNATNMVDSVPLRMAGGLHAVVLRGDDAALGAAYPPNSTPNNAALGALITAALTTHKDALMAALDSPPQTNEVRRSAVLIAIGAHVGAHYDLPLTLSELGASAGLNLFWDNYALDTGGQIVGRTFDASEPVLTLRPDWQGPRPPARGATVVDRRGVDLRPFSFANADDQLRAQSYIWPDQVDRIALTKSAIANAAQSAPLVDQGDAAAWIEHRLATPSDGTAHLIFHTIAWQYFPPATQERANAAIYAAGARATKNAR